MKRTVYLLIILFALVACVEEEKSDEITIFMAGEMMVSVSNLEKMKMVENVISLLKM